MHFVKFIQPLIYFFHACSLLSSAFTRFFSFQKKKYCFLTFFGKNVDNFYSFVLLFWTLEAGKMHFKVKKRECTMAKIQNWLMDSNAFYNLYISQNSKWTLEPLPLLLNLLLQLNWSLIRRKHWWPLQKNTRASWNMSIFLFIKFL